MCRSELIAKPLSTRDYDFLMGWAMWLMQWRIRTIGKRKITFYFSSKDHQVMFEQLKRHCLKELSSVIKKADRICSFNIPVFGKEIECNNPISWTSDPLTGDKWPDAHWSRIPVVGPTFSMDAKVGLGAESSPVSIAGRCFLLGHAGRAICQIYHRCTF